MIRWLGLLLLFLSCASGRKVLGQRDAVADKRYNIPMIESRLIDSVRPSEVISPESSGVERIFMGDPTRLVLRFDVDSLVDFWPENPVYSAYIELYVSSSRNTKISFEKPALGSYNLSATTWDCVVDTDPRDAVSVCQDRLGRFPGLATTSFDHVYDVRKNEPGVKQFDITELVRSGPGAVLIKLDDEKLYQNERADDYAAVHLNELRPRIVIHQPKGHVILSDSDKHPGSVSMTVTIPFRGQQISHQMFYWEAKNPFPQEECNIVLPLGVFFTAQVGFGQGEIANNRCNIYQFSQHCTGLTSCLRNGTNDMDTRAEILTQLLWLSPQGLRLPKGTHFYDNDQGSSLVVHTIGWMKRSDVRNGTNLMSYIGSELGYDASWTLGFWCRRDLWEAGRCSRALFPKFVGDAAPGVYQFALCSQHGPQDSRDVETSCRSRMHRKWEYWAGWSFQNPWEDSVAEADLRAKFPWLSAPKYDPTGTQKFVWFGYEALVGPTPLIPGELEYHNSWTKPTRTDYLEQRDAMAMYPDQLVVGNEFPECGNFSLVNPTCDPFKSIALNINAELGTPTPRSGPDTTFELESYYAQYLLERTGHPLDARLYFVVKPGLQDDLDFNPANGVQCLPDNNGPLTVNGSCTGYGGQCVCGHGLVGALGINTSPENLAARLENMRTFHVVSKVFSPLMCHQDLRCTDNFLHASKIIENGHGIRERYLQKVANGW